VSKLYPDEMVIDSENFIDGTLPVSSKIMTRKTFVVSKESIVKKYGTLDNGTYSLVYEKFCKYFDCVK
jgi:mRNA interferase MazF